MSEELRDKEERSERVLEERPLPGGERSRVELETTTTSSQGPSRNRNVVIVVVAVVAALAILVTALMWSRGSKTGETVKANVEAGEHKDEHGEGAGREVALSAEALEAAGIESEGVTQRPAVALLNVTGTVEVNQLQSQAVTPLVGGRVERVHAAPGDFVRAGQVLATIASPQIAQMHGKLHEAETRYELAKRNLARVERAENRAAVISAKAKLDEAEAALRRTRRLVELGAGAGKDLTAAEATYKTAKAEFDFQSNISLNKEIQEARAEVETARVDTSHIRAEMDALGAPVPEGETDDHKDTSHVALRAPVSGSVTERQVNAGAGIEAGQTLFTIANLSTVWVIANVPEAQVGSVRVGTPAEMRSAALGTGAVAGRVSYINPQLNEETRTAQVRVEVGNAGGRLKAGMFVEVGFQAGSVAATGEDLMVPSSAVQRVGDRAVVFIPKEGEPGHFEVRDVELGGEAGGYRKVLSGLTLGERVVTKGGFVLKTQLLKGEIGEDGH